MPPIIHRSFHIPKMTVLRSLIPVLLALAVVLTATTATACSTGPADPGPAAGSGSAAAAGEAKPSSGGQANEVVNGLVRVDRTWFDYFDTLSTCTIYAKSKEEGQHILDEAEKQIAHYHELFDIYHDYPGVNNIKTINDNAGGKPVKVEPIVIDYLEQSLRANEVTGGAANMALGPVLKLWHEASEQAIAQPEKAAPPSEEALKEAAQHCDIKEIVIDKEASTVRITDPKGSIDPGSGSKGLAAERVARSMEEAGVTSGLLSMGGNVRTIGHKPDGKDWIIGVQNPQQAIEMAQKGTSDLPRQLLLLKADDRAVVTSGVYQRFFEVDGRLYHHIIDPATLFPEHRYDSVTIICKDSGLADSLTTALFNLSVEDGKAVLAKFPDADCEAVWLKDGKTQMTDGLKAYIVE